MQQPLRIVMAQCNFMLGDIAGNQQKIIATAEHCRDQLNADVVVFPELAITAYPPQDLLLRPELHQRCATAITAIARQVDDIHIVIGHPQQTSRGLFNAASVLYNGDVVDSYHKLHLPNYSVFDEKRYFTRPETPQSCVFKVKNIQLGVTICEDIWHPGPFAQAIEAGADVMLCLNASPFRFKKSQQRLEILRQRQQQEGKIPILYVNCVGGQDELVFDGGSMAIDSNGDCCQAAPLFEEQLTVVEMPDAHTITPSAHPIPDELTQEQTLYQALVLGTRDYVHKNGFKRAIIGLSGGIDSALTLAIAVDALGAEQVDAVLMPSRYTSPISIEDAKLIAANFGVKEMIIPIEPSFQAFLTSLAPAFGNKPVDATEENLQARCRGVILMALSNKSGDIVLTTGNKSELAVGYSTLYGDMAGGFAVIKDLPKTMVYRLANFRNQQALVIPQRIIDRPPSAELAADQKDQDTLPPYDILDAIIEAYVEQDKSIDDIVAQGIDRATVTKVVNMIERNEYKRSQSAPGVRLSQRAFGQDWRYPITSAYQSSAD